MANTFGQAYDKLGDSRSRAAFVAVTVDPERDTVNRVRQYLVEQHLRGKMSFLTGSRPDLEAVWSAHHVAVAKGAPESGGSYDIAHSVLVYVIDAQGARTNAHQRIRLHCRSTRRRDAAVAVRVRAGRLTAESRDIRLL